jgi:hypothetical protein
MVYRLVDGVLIEPLGDVWGAFSPASGDTALLNTECAALLEVLRDGPGDPASVASVLAADCGLPAQELMPILEPQWQRLLQGGFVRCTEPPTGPPLSADAARP